MPLIAFILLAAVCLALLGFACACLTDQPAQAVERAIGSGSALPPLIEVWSVVFVAVAGAALLSSSSGGRRAAPHQPYCNASSSESLK